MAMNMKRRQFASSDLAQIKAQQLNHRPQQQLQSTDSKTETIKTKTVNDNTLEPYKIPTTTIQAPRNNLLQQTSFIGDASPIIEKKIDLATPMTRMGISLPSTQTQAHAQTQIKEREKEKERENEITVKCIMGRSTVYQPLPNLKSNFFLSCTGFARAMRNHIWGEHVFMFEKIPEEHEDDWSKWAACADTHATADEWLEVILPGFELNGVSWFVVRGIDPDTGSLQFYFCPRNDPRGNPILGEFGSMPRFDASQVSIVDGKV